MIDVYDNIFINKQTKSLNNIDIMFSTWMSEFIYETSLKTNKQIVTTVRMSYDYELPSALTRRRGRQF